MEIRRSDRLRAASFSVCDKAESTATNDIPAVVGDPVVDALTRALNFANGHSQRVSALFVTSVQDAIRAHLAQAPERREGEPAPRVQTLSRWQERRAKQYLAESDSDAVSMAGAAAACKLSRSYFIRAFKHTTGETPHRWLNRHRVERAKQLLLSDVAIAEIAIRCGFSDQSHLTRVFAKLVGLPPGTWRREYRDETDRQRSETAA